MSDVNANIGINFDTKQALANLRQLQAGLSRFNQSLTQGNIAAANAQKGLNAQLMQSINATGKFVASQKEIRTSTRSFTDALEKNQQLRVSTKVNHSNNNAIPFADGWHPYFNLGKDGIDHCTIQFGSQHMFQFDDTLIPTGFIIEDLRFENETSLQNVQLDNCFLLNNEETANCILKNKQLQLTITPDNSYPYLQIYTPPHRQSIAIENLSAAPDAFNNKIGLLMIEPNKDYLFSTSYQVKKL